MLCGADIRNSDLDYIWRKWDFEHQLQNISEGNKVRLQQERLEEWLYKNLFNEAFILL